MKNHPLFNPLLYSIGLHSFFLVVAIVYIFIAGSRYKASVFTVSLVDSQVKGAVAVEEKSEKTEELENVAVVKAPPEKPSKKLSKAEERIAALEAKKALRVKKQISVSASRTTSSTQSSAGGGTYEDLVGTIIRKNWANADFLNKNKGLIAIIIIRIARNGNVTIVGFEQKSGSPLYDREAVRAINASSPLPSPVREMELPLRFHPSD
jgi:TonB family protein